MGFVQDLLAIRLKPYQPIHSARCIDETYKVKNEDFLKRPRAILKSRPVTAVSSTRLSTAKSLSNSLQQRPSTSVTTRSIAECCNNPDNKSRQSVLASNVSTPISKLTPRNQTESSLSKQSTGEVEIQNDDQYDDFNNEISTNVSLMTVNSSKYNDFNLNRTYGNFNYKSYFEQYMNGRSKFKILKSNMPKNSPDFDSEYILYDLLENFETRKLLDLYSIHVIKPVKLRSKSIAKFHPKNYDELLKLKEIQKKSTSVECFDRLYLDKKLKISQRLGELSDIKKMKEIAAAERKRFLTNEFTDSLYPTFYARDLKQPSLFNFGSRQLKQFNQDSDNLLTKKNQMNVEKTKPYEHIDSKLRSYLKKMGADCSNSKMDTNNKRRAKTAIGLYKGATGNVLPTYKSISEKENKQKSVAPLKLGESLNKIIKEDLRLNKGPVYFVELTEENMKVFNGKVPLSEKYLTLFEWLVGIKVEDCGHFFHNPFTNNNSTNTEISNINPESIKLENPVVNLVKPVVESDPKINVLVSTKYKVDPFLNPKTEKTWGIKLPQKKMISVNGAESQIQVETRKILAVNKDYRTMLDFKQRNLKPSENYQPARKDIFGKNLTMNDFLTSRERLKKRIINNDLLKTQMTLDLFLL